MGTTLVINIPEPVVLHFEPAKLHMTNDEFFEFCQLNSDLRIERTSQGDIAIIAPTGGTTAIYNSKLTARFTVWAEQDGTGQVFDSSVEFSLPSGANRSPDVSWIRNQRWDALTQKERDRFPPICPDFVLESRSPSDSLSKLKEKMEEYIANGAGLGWLLDAFERRIYVYRPGLPVITLENPETISGEPLLKGFALDLRSIWG